MKIDYSTLILEPWRGMLRDAARIRDEKKRRKEVDETTAAIKRACPNLFNPEQQVAA